MLFDGPMYWPWLTSQWGHQAAQGKEPGLGTGRPCLLIPALPFIPYATLSSYLNSLSFSKLPWKMGIIISVLLGCGNSITCPTQWVGTAHFYFHSFVHIGPLLEHPTPHPPSLGKKKKKKKKLPSKAYLKRIFSPKIFYIHCNAQN